MTGLMAVRRAKIRTVDDPQYSSERSSTHLRATHLRALTPSNSLPDLCSSKGTSPSISNIADGRHHFPRCRSFDGMLLSLRRLRLCVRLPLLFRHTGISVSIYRFSYRILTLLALLSVSTGCRMIAYQGESAVTAVDLLVQPAHNLARMAWADPVIPAVKIDAQTALRNHQRNVDGWGIGWFNTRDRTPVHIRSPLAIVDERNRTSAAFLHATREAKGKTLFGHARACTDNDTDTLNSHPFVMGPLLFMHNGAVAGFSAFRQQLRDMLRPPILQLIGGHTDSEHAFALFANSLRQFESRSSFSSAELRRAMRETIETLTSLNLNASVGSARGDARPVDPVTRLRASEGVCDAGYNATAARRKAYDCVLGHPSSLNFLVSDGATLVATRYRSSECEEPPSLYYRRVAAGAAGAAGAADTVTNARMHLADHHLNTGGIIFASEPLDLDQTALNGWRLVGKDKLLSWSAHDGGLVCECLSVACGKDVRLGRERRLQGPARQHALGANGSRAVAATDWPVKRLQLMQRSARAIRGRGSLEKLSRRIRSLSRDVKRRESRGA